MEAMNLVLEAKADFEAADGFEADAEAYRWEGARKLFLAHEGGLSAREIAEVLGKSLSKVGGFISAWRKFGAFRIAERPRFWDIVNYSNGEGVRFSVEKALGRLAAASEADLMKVDAEAPLSETFSEAGKLERAAEARKWAVALKLNASGKPADELAAELEMPTEDVRLFVRAAHNRERFEATGSWDGTLTLEDVAGLDPELEVGPATSVEVALNRLGTFSDSVKAEVVDKLISDPAVMGVIAEGFRASVTREPSGPHPLMTDGNPADNPVFVMDVRSLLGKAKTLVRTFRNWDDETYLALREAGEEYLEMVERKNRIMRGEEKV